MSLKESVIAIFSFTCTYELNITLSPHMGRYTCTADYTLNIVKPLYMNLILHQANQHRSM